MCWLDPMPNAEKVPRKEKCFIDRFNKEEVEFITKKRWK